MLLSLTLHVTWRASFQVTFHVIEGQTDFHCHSHSEGDQEQALLHWVHT